MKKLAFLLVICETFSDFKWRDSPCFFQWVFGMAENKSRGYTEEEKEFNRAIMSYWVNFAKYG